MTWPKAGDEAQAPKNAAKNAIRHCFIYIIFNTPTQAPSFGSRIVQAKGVFHSLTLGVPKPVRHLNPVENFSYRGDTA